MNIKEIKNSGMTSCSELKAYVAKSEEANTANGKKFLKVTLQDKSGELSLMKWNATKEDESIFKVGNILRFNNLTLSEYNNDISAKMSNTEGVEVINENPGDYIFTVIPSLDSLMKSFKRHADSITDKELNTVLKAIINPKFKDFMNWPAAEKMHHNVCHGLLYHTVGILDTVEGIVNSREDFKNNPLVDLQLIKTSAMLHDVGKILEYEVDGEFNGHLSKNALIGHMNLVIHEIWDLYKEGKITKELEFMLEHLILSHHGEREKGSPVCPADINAYILHTADEFDARIYGFLYELEQLEEGEIAKKGALMLNKVRVYKTTWHSKA